MHFDFPISTSCAGASRPWRQGSGACTATQWPTKPPRRGQQEDPFRADNDLKRSHSSQRSGQDLGPLLSVTGTYLL